MAEVEQLKEEPGGDIVRFGSGDVSHALMAAGPLDRVRLWLHPVIGRVGPQGLRYRAAIAIRSPNGNSMS